MEKALDGGGGDEAGTARGRDELEYRQYMRTWQFENWGLGNTHSDRHGTALATLLGGQRVRKTKVGTPVTSSDGKDAQLGDDDGGTDSSSDFLGGLDSKTDVPLRITNDHNGLESSTLTGTGLLLDRLDL